MQPLPPIMYDARHWRDRAEEARRITEKIADSQARQAMLQVAAGYDRIAERAEARKSFDRSGALDCHGGYRTSPAFISSGKSARAKRNPAVGRSRPHVEALKQISASADEPAPVAAELALQLPARGPWRAPMIGTLHAPLQEIECYQKWAVDAGLSPSIWLSRATPLAKLNERRPDRR